MKPTLPAFILGFHGCDRGLARRLLLGETLLRESKNDWDWLAGGAYFFENDPDRALHFATQVKRQPHAHGLHDVDEPAVVGAVIAPGRCLDLLDPGCHPQLVAAYRLLEAAFRSAGRPMPENRLGADKVMRNLDCAVIRKLHEEHEKQDRKRVRPLGPFQTVRAAFFEGAPLYPGAGFADKSHVQIAVRDPSCVQGYFLPLPQGATVSGPEADADEPGASS